MESFTTERCVRVVRASVGRPDLAVRIVDVSSWEEAVGVADRYRHGRPGKSGVDSGGAVLVRPDGYVAWRRTGPVDNPHATLAEALRRIVG